MTPLISIIIPVYNVEQYLDYCLQSVLSQDYTNLEIILIDDGSTDSSGQKCDEYAKQYQGVKVIHQKNGGLSSARNTGLKEMTGEYFSFIDSDDYVRKDYISRMYNLIVSDKTDMVVCSYKKVPGEEDYKNIPQKENNHSVYNQETIKYKMISRELPMYAHGKLYKRKLADNMEFPEGRLFEDVLTCWNVLKNVNSVSYSDVELYFYRQRQDSIVNMDFQHGRMDQIYFSKRIFEEIEGDTPLKYAAGTRCFFAAADDYALVTDEFKKEKIYLVKSIKMFRKYVLKDSRAGLSLKIMALLSFLCPGIVRVLGRMYKKRKSKCLS